MKDVDSIFAQIARTNANRAESGYMPEKINYFAHVGSDFRRFANR